MLKIGNHSLNVSGLDKFNVLRYLEHAADLQEFLVGVGQGVASGKLKYSKKVHAMVEQQKEVMLERMVRAFEQIEGDIAGLNITGSVLDAFIEERRLARKRVADERARQRE